MASCTSATKSKRSTNTQEKEELNRFDAQTGFQIFPIERGGIEFDYCLDKNGDTAKLWTSDPHFSTIEGYTMHTKWSELPDSIVEKAFKISGWGYYVPLANDWKLCFCVGKSCTDFYPTGDMTVGWIEKYGY